MVHVLDGTEHAYGREGWKPCESCPQHDRLAASLVYRHMASRGPNRSIPLFASGIRGGFFIRPALVHLRCAYSTDGGSRFKSNGCIGCLGKGCHADGWCVPRSVSSLVPALLQKTQNIREPPSGQPHTHRLVILGNSTEECARPQAVWQAAFHVALCGRKAWPPDELEGMLLALQQLRQNIGPCGPSFGTWSDPNIELVVNTTQWQLPSGETADNRLHAPDQFAHTFLTLVPPWQ